MDPTALRLGASFYHHSYLPLDCSALKECLFIVRLFLFLFNRALVEAGEWLVCGVFIVASLADGGPFIDCS